MGLLTRDGAARPARPPRGFTLVEILVVLAILALGTGAVALAFAAPDASARREAERFADALSYAAQRAQWRQETLGVGAGGDGWRFWRRDAAQGWVPLAGDETLAARTLPAGTAIAARTLAGSPVRPDALVPLRATGRNDPATFELEGGGTRWRVSTDALNRVRVEPAS